MYGGYTSDVSAGYSGGHAAKNLVCSRIPRPTATLPALASRYNRSSCAAPFPTSPPPTTCGPASATTPSSNYAMQLHHPPIPPPPHTPPPLPPSRLPTTPTNQRNQTKKPKKLKKPKNQSIFNRLMYIIYKCSKNLARINRPLAIPATQPLRTPVTHVSGLYKHSP